MGLVFLLSCAVGQTFAGTLVPIVGGANSVAADPSTPLAYVSNEAGLLVVDVSQRKVTANYPLGASLTRVEDVDPTTGLLSLSGFYDAAIATPSTGIQQTLIHGGALYGAIIAGGQLFAPDFNGRVLTVMALSGGERQFINPYPTATEAGNDVAGPCSVAASPDRQTVAFGDKFHRAIHFVRVSDRALIATIAVGMPPCRGYMLFLDDQRVVSVGSILEHGVTRPVAVIVDVRTPNAPVTILRLPFVTMSRITSFAVVDDHTLLVGLSDEGARIIAVEIAASSARLVGQKELDEPVVDLGVSSDRQHLLMAGESGLTIQQLPLSDETAGATIDGCLRVDGAPVSGASVRLKRGQKRGATTTDEAGCYSLRVPAKARGKVTITLPASP